MSSSATTGKSDAPHSMDGAISKLPFNKGGAAASLRSWKDSYKTGADALWLIHDNNNNNNNSNNNGTYVKLTRRASQRLEELYNKYVTDCSSLPSNKSPAVEEEDDDSVSNAAVSDSLNVQAFLATMEKERARVSKKSIPTTTASTLPSPGSDTQLDVVVCDEASVVPSPSNSIPLPWSLSNFVTTAMDPGYDVPMERVKLRSLGTRTLAVDFARMRIIDSHQLPTPSFSPIARIGPKVAPGAASKDHDVMRSAVFNMLLKRGELSDLMKENALWFWFSQAAGPHPFYDGHVRTIEARYIAYKAAQRLLEEMTAVDPAGFSGDLNTCCEEMRQLIAKLEKVHVANRAYGYEIDLKSMTQRNLVTNHVRKIERRLLGNTPILSSLVASVLPNTSNPLFLPPTGNSAPPSLQWFVYTSGKHPKFVKLPKRHSSTLEAMFVEFHASPQDKKTGATQADGTLVRSRIGDRMSIIDIKNMVLLSSRQANVHRLIRVGPIIPNLPPIPMEFPAFMPVANVVPHAAASSTPANGAAGMVTISALRSMYAQLVAMPPNSAATSPQAGPVLVASEPEDKAPESILQLEESSDGVVDVKEGMEEPQLPQPQRTTQGVVWWGCPVGVDESGRFKFENEVMANLEARLQEYNAQSSREAGANYSFSVVHDETEYTVNLQTMMMTTMDNSPSNAHIKLERAIDHESLGHESSSSVPPASVHPNPGATNVVSSATAVWKFGPYPTNKDETSAQGSGSPGFSFVTFEAHVCDALEKAYLNFLASRILSVSSSSSSAASSANILDITHGGVALRANMKTMVVTHVNGSVAYVLRRTSGTGEAVKSADMESSGTPAQSTQTVTPGANDSVVWTWKSNRAGTRETVFDGATSESIEKAYQKFILDGPQASPFVSLAYPNGLPYELDFSTMTQLSVVSGRRRKIQRDVRPSTTVAGSTDATPAVVADSSSASPQGGAVVADGSAVNTNAASSSPTTAPQWVWTTRVKQHLFSAKQNEILETAYATYVSNPSPTTSTLNLFVRPNTYVVDFAAMKQTNTATGAQRTIQRIVSPSTDVVASTGPADDSATPDQSTTSAQTTPVTPPLVPSEEGRASAVLREEKAAWIGQTSADPASGKQWTSDVHKDDNAVYQCMLNKTDIRQNNNKFYFMQILRERGPPQKWYLFSRYGRVGDSGATHMQNVNNASEAVKMFQGKFADKTGTAWSNRTQFEKKRGKYWLMQIDNRTKEEREATAEGGATVVRAVKPAELPSKLSPAVQQLVEFISDRSDMDEAMRRMSIDTKRMPLGRITATQIKDAYQCLKQIEDELRKPIATPAVLEDLSSSFYTLVPHVSSSRRALPLIASMVRLQEKVDMLQTLSDLEVASSVLKRTDSTTAAGDSEAPAPHRLDRIYGTLGCHLELLSPSDAVHQRIQQYCRNTHGTTHAARLEVADVFVVKRDAETAKYEAERAAMTARLAGFKDNSFTSPLNTQMLWHGSRKTNFMGILSQGLRIAPPEAPSTGYMFGKGIYMSDVCTKAAGYCHAYNSSNTGLMVLSEVALGRMKCYTDAHYMETAEKGFESTKGLGQTAPYDTEAEVHDNVKWPMGTMRASSPPPGAKRLSLLYPEYIIYSTAQYRMRYLVRMMFKK